LLANRKTREGDDNPDRDAQFQQINRCVSASLAAAASYLGRYEEEGACRRLQERRLQGEPEEVRVRDFLIMELGRAVPYGIYDKMLWMRMSAATRLLPNTDPLFRPDPAASRPSWSIRPNIPGPIADIP
jgi:hypothetical protein